MKPKVGEIIRIRVEDKIQRRILIEDKIIRKVVIMVAVEGEEKLYRLSERKYEGMWTAIG